MAYADLSYYTDTYLGTTADDAEITKYLERAADAINNYCVSLIDVDTLAVFQVENLKKANCAQAEYFIINGDTWQDEYDNVSIGSFSISGGKQKTTNGLCENAIRYLVSAGLAFGGLKCGRYHGLF